MNKPILFEIKDRIGHIILNSPPSNSMTKEFFIKFNKIVNSIDIKKISVLLIYSLNRHFSSGADIKELLTTIKNQVETDNFNKITKYSDFLLSNNSAFLKINSFDIPVIVAVRGVCLGSALELALFSHIRIATENAVFGFPESEFNLMPGLGGTQKILQHVKKSKAIELILRGSTFSAEDALKLNIIDLILKKEEILPMAEKIASYFANIKNYDKNYSKYYLKTFLKNQVKIYE